MPQNDSEAQQRLAPQASSSMPDAGGAAGSGVSDGAAPGSQAAAGATGASQPAAREPLPGEPGFKARLTEKQLKRANQTIKGMFISVGLTVAVVLPIIWMNPSSTKATYDQHRVDVALLAQQTITTQDFKAISPDFPDGWYANAASWDPGAADGVGFWQIGVVQGESSYAQVRQAENATPSWIALATDGSTPTGQSVQVDNVTWQVRSYASEKAPKTILTTTIGTYTYLITVDQGDEDFAEQTAKLVQAAAPTA